MSEDIILDVGTITESLNNKVDSDFGNVPNNSVGFAKYSTEVTNCITEIPQDIKLELVDGVLTLKAGSKVYVPNGFEADGVTPKFDVKIIESDTVVGQAGTYTGALIFARTDKPECYTVTTGYISSGTTQPSSPLQTQTWYDTANNIIKVYDNGQWISGASFSLGVFSNKDSLVTSIDQIFNGFGYIGSTVFALPGVKGLIPNGRNADGSLKNIEFATQKVLLTENPANARDNLALTISANSINRISLEYYSYDELNNLNYDGERSAYFSTTIGVVYSRDSSGKITSFTQKTTFQAVDRNDSSWLSSLGMPGSKYTDLTLGASNSEYTAPANGCFYFAKVSGKDSSYGVIMNSTKGYSQQMTATGTNNWVRGILSAQKGDVVKIEYSATGSTQAFRFIYAEGEK